MVLFLIKFIHLFYKEKLKWWNMREKKNIKMIVCIVLCRK